MTHLTPPVLYFGFISCCLGCFASGLALTSAQLSVEIMVTIAALKSAIAWIWTWVINDFITACGVLTVFMTVASINVAVYLSYIPFYYYGKRIRQWLHRKDFFSAAVLR